MKQKKLWALALVTVLAILLALSACAGDPDASSVSPAPSESESASTMTDAGDTSAQPDESQPAGDEGAASTPDVEGEPEKEPEPTPEQTPDAQPEKEPEAEPAPEVTPTPEVTPVPEVTPAPEASETTPPAHTHEYKDTVVAPTCENGGYTVHTCDCGHSYSDKETKATGHSYTEKVVAPTTSAQGYTLHTCSKCGTSYKDSYVDKLPTQTTTPSTPGNEDFESDGWKGDDYGSGETIVGNGQIAGQFVDNSKYTRKFYTPGMGREGAIEAINKYLIGVFGGPHYFNDGIKVNYEDTANISKFVEDENGRVGINVFSWRKSYDSSATTNEDLNITMEAFYFMCGDKDVAFALWSWVDAMEINGRANSDNYGFHDVVWNDSQKIIEMNGIQIEYVPGSNGNTFYFN